MIMTFLALPLHPHVNDLTFFFFRFAIPRCWWRIIIIIHGHSGYGFLDPSFARMDIFVLPRALDANIIFDMQTWNAFPTTERFYYIDGL